MDSVLTAVLTGLRAATSVPRGATVSEAATSIQQAADQFALAGRGLSPIPAGVPPIVAGPVATRVGQLSALFQQAATCLAQQENASAPDPTPCLPPLRQANQKDAQLAHELIGLAVYSSRSPKTFESQLVRALH